jgi:hypothetical protein
MERDYVRANLHPDFDWLRPGQAPTIHRGVTGAAVFFASSDAEFCSGSVLLVDGAMQAGVRIDAAVLATD